MSFKQQKDILDHTYELLTKFNHGVPPKVHTTAIIRSFWFSGTINVGERCPLVGDKQRRNRVAAGQGHRIWWFHSFTSLLPFSYMALCAQDHSSMAHEWVLTPQTVLVKPDSIIAVVKHITWETQIPGPRSTTLRTRLRGWSLSSEETKRVWSASRQIG